MSRPARVLSALIALYQRAFSWRASPCRFHPSCSTYGREALAVHGAVRGSWLALRRLGRCNPWGGFGMDPVPLPRSGRARSGPSPSGMRTNV